jgi:hypothetical protein
VIVVAGWPKSPQTVSSARHAPAIVRVTSISLKASLLLELKTVRGAKAFG